MKKFYVGIKNEVSSNTLELYFTDYIYDGLDWSTWEVSNMVQETIDKIKAANPTTIKIVINSLGGDVMIGLALYNYLKAHKATKEVEIIGFAASIASILAMCGDTIKMAKNSFMIIHAAWSYASGNAAEMRKAAEDLDKVTNELADIYAQRSGKDTKFFTDLWAEGDYWMTGSEAKELNLVDELFNAAPISAHLDFNQHGFKNIPAEVIDDSLKKNEHKTWFDTVKNDFMKITDSLKNAISGGKKDEKNKDVEKRDEILAMVENVLKPFAEAIDQALEEVKPAPGGEEDKPPAEKPENVKPDKTEEQKKIEDLENKLQTLTRDIAANIAKPGKEDEQREKIENQVKVEYE